MYWSKLILPPINLWNAPIINTTERGNKNMDIPALRESEYFHSLKRGDRINCIAHGEGVVESVVEGILYPINILFDDGISRNYTMEGYSSDSPSQIRTISLPVADFADPKPEFEPNEGYYVAYMIKGSLHPRITSGRYTSISDFLSVMERESEVYDWVEIVIG